jgi:hypothetical protein
MISMRTESSRIATRSRACGKLKKTQERLLDAIQGIVGPNALAAHHAHDARPMLVHEASDPTIKPNVR